ncbi:hypothetical protein RX411_14985 [Faecalibacterium prausnitzii]|nr:hypothetical protein [Faecalibacterium prausnitzii]
MGFEAGIFHTLHGVFNMWKNRRPFTECIPHFCGKLSAPAKPSGGGGRAVKTLRTKGQKTAILWQTGRAYVILYFGSS